jgi:hypothetical protein
MLASSSNMHQNNYVVKCMSGFLRHMNW